jgi:hypothetical protein
MSDEEFWPLLDPDEPCFTEDDLRRLGVPPVPEWMRRPPKRGQREFFENE